MSGAVVTGADRVWTKWSDERPPNEPGEYRYRIRAKICGMVMQPEWTEKMHYCGMGYGDAEYWPLTPCHWNGYSRYITHEGLEWSPVQDSDPAGVVWGGLDLLPCPFTGAAPTVSAQGQLIGAPLWRSEALWIGSPGVPKRRFTDANAMLAAWNTRATTAQLDALREALPDLQALLEFAESAEAQELVGDEGCLWVVENGRQALATLTAAIARAEGA
jgi:hypothetical protein